MPSDTGVLVVNLGTPDAPTPEAVRRFLAEFLSDPRVVNLPRLPWQIVLRTFILPFRPEKSARAYREIWTPAGSPLLTGSEALTRALVQKLAALPGEPPAVAMGMTYGNPSIDHALQKLQSAGVRRLVVLPLYPQYSATTTAAALDRVDAALARWRAPPERLADRGLPRRARPRRGARGEHRRRARALRSPAVLIPRHPAPLCGGGRSLRRTVPGDRPARRRAPRAARGALVGRVPVARRGRALARALHGGSPARARARGRSATCRRLPRICGGLPRNARGDRDPRRRDIHIRRRGRLRVHPGAQRLRPRRSSASRASSRERLP